jgi:hypothetical protein
VSQAPRSDQGSNTPGVDPFADVLSVSDLTNFEQLWAALAVPRLPGFAPAAITAVLVAKDASGNTARYPVHAQLSTAELNELYEVEMAIDVLERWRRGSPAPEANG